MLVSDIGCCAQKMMKHSKKTGCALRTHPAKSHRQQRYVQQGVPRRERSVFLCWGHDEPVPPAIGKLTFAQRSVAMKVPVGLLSGRAVLRSKMEGHCPDKLGGICDKEYHGLRRASRWFCKFYCSKAVIVGLIFNTRQETISVSHIVMFAEKTYNAFEPVGHTKRRKERES